MTLRARSTSRFVGPGVVVALVLGMAVLWLLARPTGQEVGSFVGQLLGAESILLLSIGLVLISTLPWVETWFDGLDRAAIWHRRVAITGTLLLVPHILLSNGGGGPSWANPAGVVATVGLAALVVWAILPRWRSLLPAAGHRLVLAVHDLPPVQLVSRLVGNYEIWRGVHRTTGLFVAIGFAHGLADATPFAQAPVLRWTYVAVGGVGLSFYAYRELLARRGHGLRDYQVREVHPVGAGFTEITLGPLGKPLRYAPGQFAMLHLESKEGWHRHPFTLASSPDEANLRFTVKALGDYTSRVPDLVRPGMPAVVSGPHGRFSHTKGTAHQLWVAGGVGVTPFLSWMRSLDHHPPPGRVDLFYSTTDEAPYADELRSIAAAHPAVAVHVLRTRVDGRLTAARLLEPVGDDRSDLSVFMCGPGPMLAQLKSDLCAAGISPRRIFREHFDWR